LPNRDIIADEGGIIGAKFDDTFAFYIAHFLFSPVIFFHAFGSLFKIKR
jgi:hypothetical protein